MGSSFDSIFLFFFSYPGCMDGNKNIGLALLRVSSVFFEMAGNALVDIQSISTILHTSYDFITTMKRKRY